MEEKAPDTFLTPRVAADSELSICGGHCAFYKKGSELRLLDGWFLNPKPAEAPKAGQDG